jgi:F-type H+-transporting ATPase subunit alpha
MLAVAPRRAMTLARACRAVARRAAPARRDATATIAATRRRPGDRGDGVSRRARGTEAVARARIAGKPVPEDARSSAAPTVESVEDEDRMKNFSGTCARAERGGVVALEGMRSAAPPGAVLRFADGGRAVLLSHREPKTFALMFDGGEGGERRRTGDGARAVGKTAEASKTEFVWGPSARATRGKIVDAFGEARDGSAMVTGTEDSSKMMREPPSVEERKPITTPLVTGIKAVDLLAPVGRGQCMLVSGEPGTGLSELGLTSIVAQRSTGVRCVYAALGAQASRVDEVAKRLEGDGAMSHTTIVTVDDEPSEAERYAATCTAFAIAEGARALGEDVLLVLDDFTGLVNFTKDMARMAPQLNVAEGTEEQMEEYEGMLISASLAERRRFLGMTLQRVARMNDELKGGSITLMGVMYHPKGAYKKTFKSGVEGAGSGGAVLPSSVESIKGFDSMPAAVQEKLRKALEEKAKAAHVSTADDEFPESAFVQSRPMVEEFMSITDGQVFVDSYDPAKGWIISAKDSVSRIGAPGAAGPFRSLNFLQLRLDLMQSDDMGTFGSAGTEKSKLRSRSEAIRGFLKQKQGEVASLAEQTVGLFAIQKGFANNKTAEEVEDMLAKAVKRATETMREELEYINTNPSSALSEETMTKLETLLRNL